MRHCPKCKSKATEKLPSPSFQERWRCRGCGSLWARAPQDEQFTEEMERRTTEETEAPEEDSSVIGALAGEAFSEMLSSPEPEPPEPEATPEIEPGGGDFGGGGASGDF